MEIPVETAAESPLPAAEEPCQRIVNYDFVDEAGDTTFYGKRAKIIVGDEGCSTHFMLGVARIADPTAAAAALESLRANLLADPYFKNVPSMQPDQKKTALCFHAKDDCPEVRREVLKLLPSLGAEIHVAIRRKHELVNLSQKQKLVDPAYRINPDEIYDELVMRLFENMLHKGDETSIVFARRGKSDRIKALGGAIQKSKDRFEKKCKKVCKPTTINAMYPTESVCLQVVDYYLWAIQRMYEKNESRFFDLLQPNYCVIMDLDDKRNRPRGEIYSRRKPLTPEKLKAP